MSTKLSKKNLLKVQKLLCSNSQKTCRNVLNKIFFCFKVPSWQLKCNFENPASKLSPGVSKSLLQCRIENFRKLFFQKIFPSELCSGHLDRNFDVPTEKKLSKVQSSFGQIPEKVSSRIFLKRNLVSQAKFVWILKRDVRQPWWKKLVEGPEIFDKMVEMIEKNEFFQKKRNFSTMFFSERLKCSSFDKLKRNFSKNSRKKVCSIFEICKNNVFCQEQSSQFSSGHLKRSFDNPAETFAKV